MQNETWALPSKASEEQANISCGGNDAYEIKDMPQASGKVEREPRQGGG